MVILRLVQTWTCCPITKRNYAIRPAQRVIPRRRHSRGGCRLVSYGEVWRWKHLTQIAWPTGVRIAGVRHFIREDIIIWHSVRCEEVMKSRGIRVKIRTNVPFLLPVRFPLNIDDLLLLTGPNTKCLLAYFIKSVRVRPRNFKGSW